MIDAPVRGTQGEDSGELSPVFLIGTHRSGTTALALALSRAFAAAGGCFTVNGKLPYLLKRWWTQNDLDHQHLRADEVEHGLRRMSVSGVGAGAWIDRASTALRAGAARAAKQASANVEEEIRLVCQETYGTRPWGDKYNEYLLDLPWLAGIFPTARWIFLAREPRDVVASMLTWRREKVWNPCETRAASVKWAAWTDCWLRFRDSLEPERVFEVGYEQLLNGGGTRLSGWLDLDVETHLSHFEVRKRSGLAELTQEAIDVRRSLARLGLLAADAGPR